MDESIHDVLRTGWREREALLLQLACTSSSSKENNDWEFQKNKALLQLVHKNEELTRQVDEMKTSTFQWETKARCSEERLKKIENAQHQASVLHAKCQRLQASIVERSQTIIRLKQLAAVFSSWHQYGILCKQDQVLVKLTNVWNRKLLSKWFGAFQDGFLAAKGKKLLLQKCTNLKRKYTLSNCLYSWHKLSIEGRTASKVSETVTRLRTRRMIYKSIRFWRLVCYNAMYEKRQYHRAGMSWCRKLWNGWRHLTRTTAIYKHWASQFYINKVKSTIFSRWKVFYKKSVEKEARLFVSSRQREIKLIELSFNSWFNRFKKKLMLSEREMTFSSRRCYKVKRNVFRNWIQLTNRHRKRRDFTMSFITKRQEEVKRIFIFYLATQRSQRKLVAKFISKQSSRTRLSVLHEWWFHVLRNKKYSSWTLLKGKNRDIQCLKKALFSWSLYHEMRRTAATLRNVDLLEDRIQLINAELKESQRLKVQIEKLYSTFEIKNDDFSYAAEKILSQNPLLIKHKYPSLLEVELQWTPIIQADMNGPSSRAGHSSVAISCFADKKVSTYIVVFGGYNGEYAFNDIYVLDTGLNAWKVPIISTEEGITVPSPIWNHTACAFENKMIVFGGFDGHQQSSELSMLSFSDDASYCIWSRPRCSMGAKPSPLSQHTSCLYKKGRYMVVFGGYSTCDSHLNELWVLDLHILSWTSPECFGSPPSKRRGHGAAIIRDKMFIYGGFDGISHFNDLHSLDLQSFLWTPINTSGEGPTPRRHHAFEAVGDHLVVYGGYDGEYYLEDVHSLDINTNIWKRWHVLKPGEIPADDIGGNGTMYGRSLHTMTFDERRFVIFGGVHANGSLEDVIYLESVYDAQCQSLKNFAIEEATDNLKLQRKINSFEDLLQKQSRDLITAVNRATHFELAYENEQKERRILIGKNSILRKKLEKQRSRCAANH